MDYSLAFPQVLKAETQAEAADKDEELQRLRQKLDYAADVIKLLQAKLRELQEWPEGTPADQVGLLESWRHRCLQAEGRCLQYLDELGTVRRELNALKYKDAG